jgi:phosphomannomutase
MRQEDVVIGGEESGGLSILHHIPEKDGIIANLLIVEAMAYEQKSLKDLCKDLKAEIGHEFFNERLDLKVDDIVKKAFVQKLAKNPPDKVNGIKVSKVSTMDGAKLYLEDDSWILTRPSGTEPLLRVYVEAHSLDSMQQIIKEMKELLEEVKKEAGAILINTNNRLP